MIFDRRIRRPLPWVVAASSVAVTFGTIAVLLESGPAVSEEPPKSTDWMQAVASIGGAVFTMLAFLAAAYALWVERVRRQEDIRRLDRQRVEEAARRVVGWLEVEPKDKRQSEVTGRREEWSVQIYVGNFSSEPMLNVLFYAGSVEEDGSWFESRYWKFIKLLPPGKTVEFDLVDEAPQSADGLITGANMRGNWALLIMGYEDASGNKWLRDRKGRLLPMTLENVGVVRENSNILRSDFDWILRQQ
ncbi:hypothetical protein AB0F95_06845 [Micromonospora tulbaghiae]|uniref:hypothetical protein n=1 Tax=Micromonospora tulbaghiae TaxID=479978 RepID=UPI0033D39CC1